MAINWTQVNVPTILAVAGAAIGLFNYIGDFDKRLSEQEQYRTIRSSQTDSNFAMVNKSIEGLRYDQNLVRESVENIPYRVGVVEQGLIEQGKRTDRLSELILNNMDVFRKDINQLGTKIEVLASKIDDNFPSKRTQLMLSTPPDIPARN